jgi:hypothetical protein
MDWPAIENVTAGLSLPPGATVRYLALADVEALPALILRWYPRVAVGAESVFLQHTFLCSRIALAEALAASGTQVLADIAVFVLELDNTVRGIVSFEREPACSTLHARLGVLDPELRVAFVGALGVVVFERLGKLMGAELLLQWVTLASRAQQALAERRGFQLYGLVPGFDRDQVSPGVARRVTEALFGKLLTTAEDCEAPERKELTLSARNLATCIGIPTR